MARHFQTTPIFCKQCMAQAVDVRRGYYEAPGRWPEPFPTLTQEIYRISNVFDDVTECYHIVGVGIGQIRYRTEVDVKSLMLTVAHSCGIGIDAGHLPTKQTHSSKELTISATHIQETSLHRQRQGKN